MPMLILLNPLKHGDRDVTYLFSTEMSGIEEFPDRDYGGYIGATTAEDNAAMVASAAMVAMIPRVLQVVPYARPTQA